MVKLYILKTIAITISIVSEHLRSCFFVVAPCNFSFESQNAKNSFSDAISTNLTTFDSTHIQQIQPEDSWPHFSLKTLEPKKQI